MRRPFSRSNELILLTDLIRNYHEVAILYFPDLAEVSRQVTLKICQVSLILRNRPDSHVRRAWVKREVGCHLITLQYFPSVLPREVSVDCRP